MPALGYDRDAKPQLVSVYLAARSRKCQLLALCPCLCQGWLTGPPTCSHSVFHPASIHHPLLWASTVLGSGAVAVDAVDTGSGLVGGSCVPGACGLWTGSVRM